MPRTKRPVRKPVKTAEEDEAIKKMNNFVQEVQNQVDVNVARHIRQIEMTFRLMIAGMKREYLTKTLRQLRDELYIKESIPTTARRTRHSRRATRAGSQDDGYLTEGSSLDKIDSATAKKKFETPSSNVSLASARSHSAVPSSRKIPVSSRKGIKRRSQSNMYRTPACNTMSSHNYPLITPKVNPQTPLTVLRQPRQGEMVVSMSGSPVMVPACFAMPSGEKANCNILLQDGTTLSLQPKHLRQSQAFIPFSLMDNNVLSQLKTLKENLEKVVKLGEKHALK